MTGVERHALASPGLVATVGRVDAEPGSTNVVAGRCVASLDVRHAEDAARTASVDALLELARGVAAQRGLSMSAHIHVDQPATPMHPGLVERLGRAVDLCALPRHVLASGGGHDAMILAGCMPAAMLFVRSPGGISHHPDESVLAGDVAAALAVGERFLQDLTWPV
jgi:allantoate deiminase